MLFRTLIYEDATQNDMPTILQDLSSKSQGSEGGGGGGGGGGGERRKGREGRQKKMLRQGTKVILI